MMMPSVHKSAETTGVDRVADTEYNHFQDAEDSGHCCPTPHGPCLKARNVPSQPGMQTMSTLMPA